MATRTLSGTGSRSTRKSVQEHGAVEGAALGGFEAGEREGTSTRADVAYFSVTQAEHNVPRRVSSAEPAGERRVRERVLTTLFGVLDHDLGGHPV